MATFNARSTLNLVRWIASEFDGTVKIVMASCDWKFGLGNGLIFLESIFG